VGAGRGKEFGVVDVARVTSKLEWLGLLFVRVFLLLVASVFFFPFFGRWPLCILNSFPS
jgi:hypothetical protein